MPRQSIAHLVFALALWLALGFSLGWYYTITYYGRSGAPLPIPEGMGGLIVYYFSVQNMPTPWQAVHWMAVFPLAGVVWSVLLAMTAPFFEKPRVGIPRACLGFAVTTIPLSLPGPVLAVLAGFTNDGWSFTRMINVALRRAGMGPPPDWLTPLYVVLGFVALLIHLAVYARLFETTLRAGWRHYLFSAILFVFVVAGIGALAAVPLAILTQGVIPMPPGIR